MIKPVIFCDFDGTITLTDNMVDIMNQFAPPEAEDIKKKIFKQQISIMEGVEEIFNLLPSNLKEDIIQFVLNETSIRTGFQEFVEYTRAKEIPLYIVSGGIDFFLKPKLEAFGPFNGIYCNGSDFNGDTIQLTYPNSCDNDCPNQQCGCCKPSIIRKHAHEGHPHIVIGDSTTDFEASHLADLVIARDALLKRCQEKNIAHKPFETFHDCLNILKKLMGGGESVVKEAIL